MRNVGFTVRLLAAALYLRGSDGPLAHIARSVW